MVVSIGTAEELRKESLGARSSPSAAQAGNGNEAFYRSDDPLRHPKAATRVDVFRKL
jgi:hypothetical protein